MLKRALFASAVLVIGAMYMQGAVTPASAGSNNPKITVKPKISVKPKMRIRVVRPKVRIKIDPKLLARDKPEKIIKAPTKLQARKVEQPAVKGNAYQAFQAILGDFVKTAEAANEAAAAAEAARRAKDFDIAKGGLVPVDPKDDLTGGGGNAGNNKSPIDMSPGEFADRFGASKTAREVEAGLAEQYGNLGNRGKSSATSDWSKSTGIVPDPTKIPTGGLASSETTRDEGDGTLDSATTTKTVNDDGTVRVTKNSVGGGAAVESDALYSPDGELGFTTRTAAFSSGYTYSVHRDWSAGFATQYDNTGHQTYFKFDRETGGFLRSFDLDRTQTGEEQTTSILPMPSCGSAACNALRRGLGIRSLATAGTRTNPGPDGKTPTTQAPSVSAIINQDDLVKTNVAGDAANSETNRTARELKDKGLRY
jgi:hypothetical protein